MRWIETDRLRGEENGWWGPERGLGEQSEAA